MNELFIKYRFVFVSFFIWLVILIVIIFVSPLLIPLRTGYIGPSVLANFDGVHYLRIAREGYFQYGEAFFPLYPLVIRLFSTIIPLEPYIVAVMVSLVSFFVGLSLFYSFVVSEKDTGTAKFATVYLLSFPTSFYFLTVYTEGLFFLLVMACITLVKKNRWILAGFVGALASATRLVGIFLIVYMVCEYIRLYRKKIVWPAIIGITIVPVGLLSFMYFLYGRTGDPFAFMHVQSAFGANRSNVPIVLLPQVVWRYLKIIVTAYLQPTPVSYIVSIFELVMTVGAFTILWVKRNAISLGFSLFSLFVLIVPTLTGTFSSMPRYILSAFPLFILLASSDNTKLKRGLIGVFCLLQILAAGLFLRGWFIA